MSKIAIITDTDASMPAELAAQYNIQLVPINIHFGQEEFKTGIDIQDVDLFVRIDKEGKLPTTSAPTPGQFAEVYEAALSGGAETVLCYCVSSEISATYQSALTACELFEGRDIEVIDSRTLSMAQGFMALAAAEAAQAGAAKAEVIAHAMSVHDRTHLYAALATLKYLAMSGRVGHLAAGMASLLNIKPILTAKDGKLDMLEKVRTRKKAWRRMIELVVMALDGKSTEKMSLIHVNALTEAQQFLEQLRGHIACPDHVIMADFTAGLSVHAGSGLVGVVAVAAESGGAMGGSIGQFCGRC